MIIADVTDYQNMLNTNLSSLWGDVVSEKKPVAITIEQLRNRKLLISHATLGELVDRNDKLEEEGRSLLSFKINDRDEVLLCSLRLKKKEMCGLELELDGLANVVFSVKGRREIHLVGSYSNFVGQRTVNRTGKEPSSRILPEDDHRETVEANIPPYTMLIPYSCGFPTFNYLNCPIPAQLDIPKPREAQIKLVITSDSMPPNDTQMVGPFQHGSKHAQLQDQPYEGSCLSSIRRKLDMDQCKKSEVQVWKIAAVSPHMEDQINSFGAISTIEPTMVVEHAKKVVAVEQDLDTTQVTSSKHDSDQAGKFERDSHQKGRQKRKDKHVAVVPNDSLALDGNEDGTNADEDNHESHQKGRQKRKDKHVAVVPNDSLTLDGNEDGTNAYEDNHESHQKGRQKRKDKHVAVMPNDSLTLDGNEDGTNADEDNHESNKKRKRKREDNHVVLQNDAQTRDGNEDGNNVDGDSYEGSSDNSQHYYVLYHEESKKQKHINNEADGSRKGKKKKQKQEKEIDEDDHKRCAEQPYSELELDAGGAKNNHKRKKKTRNDDVRCAEHGDTDVSVDLGEAKKKLKNKKKVESVENRPLGSTTLGQQAEARDNLSGVSGVICALAAMHPKVR